MFVNSTRRRFLLLAGATVPRILAERRNRISKVDLFPRFFEVWTDGSVASPEARAERFLRLVVRPNVDLYEAFTGEMTPERATRYIERVEPLLPAIRTLHQWVDSGFEIEMSRLATLLPDLAWNGKVVFMPNLFVFDAGGGPLNGEEILIFGLDTIARRSGVETDMAVLTSHEIFHQYHASFHPDWKNQRRGVDSPLYQLVWKEGLATYASQKLNPHESISAIFSDSMLVPLCESHLATLAAALRNNVDSTQRDSMMEWMSAGKRKSDVPARAGYYFGWRLASELGKTRTLPRLARMPDEEIRSLMIRWLELTPRTQIF